MATITIAQMNDALATTLEDVTGITTTQSYDELTSGMVRGNLPLLQVYWNSMGPMARDGETDRSSFGAAIRHKIYRYTVDLYAAPISHVGQIMGEMLPLAESLITQMEAQDVPPYFGLEGIQAWQLESADRVVLDYGGGSGQPARFLGVRFVLAFHVF